MSVYDLLVIGGGINGVGIARDAAGRGLSVCLCEKDDFASHTSSWSTKLIHGGLRYLEHKEFRLVRESLIEREVLLNAAPHLIEPMRFVLPHHQGMRPAWMLRAGLFIYDHIGGRKALPSTARVDLRTSPLGTPLADGFRTAFEYTDCRVDDSRLVIFNAIDAAVRGAVLKTRTRFVGGQRSEGGWSITLEDQKGGRQTVHAKAVVNAAGPWANDALGAFAGASIRKNLRLVKGSHIITKPLYDHDRAYIFQNADGRVVFTIPYLNNTTLIGTTDEPYEGDPGKAAISDEEVRYLCASVSEYLKQDVTPDHVVDTYSGVRPLYDELSSADASAVTRDYAFDVEADDGVPLLSIYGGKLTTYRKLAEHALEKLKPFLPAMGAAWTRGASLPGGEMAYAGWSAWRRGARERYAFLSDPVFDRMVRAYGSRLDDLLKGVTAEPDLGTHFGAGLYEVEVRYLVEHEFVRSGDDLLTRRTKLYSAMSPNEQEAVCAFVDRLQTATGCAA